MKRFMVVRANEKYMGELFDTRQEAETEALGQCNGDPGGDFQVFELISTVTRPPSPTAVLTRIENKEPNILQDLGLNKSFFLNEAHELPRITKYQLRKQNKMLRDAKKTKKKWCSICRTGPAGLWEFAEKGSDFCRKHK